MFSQIESQIIEEYKKQTSALAVEIEAVRKPTEIFNSKLGGIPYFPKDLEYPCSLQKISKGKPLQFLAQLNFEEFPYLPDFPITGILQFYIDQEDDVYGLDFDNPTNQSGFRVIYHKNIIKDRTLLQSIPESLKKDENTLPFKGEFQLVGKLVSQSMTLSDFRFSQIFLNICKKYLNKNEQDIEEIYEELYNKITDGEVEKAKATGHRMGGYPFFTQTDPREYNKELQNHTTLLLQIDSDGEGEDEIIWGDCGVANFFIKKEDLKNLNFSNVVYNWDCF